MNTQLPEWWIDATPEGKRRANPGKHETYVFGQGSADGTACIGCDWETHGVLSGAAAVAQHDEDRKLTHDHDLWVPIEHGLFAGTCPCGKPDSDGSALHERVLAALQAAKHWNATPEQLAKLVVEALVPEHHFLVDLEVITDHEVVDSTYGLRSSPVVSWSTLSDQPELLAHRLDPDEAARLVAELRAGNLADAYSGLDGIVEALHRESTTPNQEESEE